jgi:hypothetical protein
LSPQGLRTSYERARKRTGTAVNTIIKAERTKTPHQFRRSLEIEFSRELQ